MGSASRAGTGRLLRILALSAVVIGVIATLALAAGPGGWDHLGEGPGTPPTTSLDFTASALAVSSDVLYVGGGFSNAGGVPEADRIAKWNGSTWSAVSSSTERIPGGDVLAIAVHAGKVYAGGTFQDAGPGGATNADFLAVWDGASWEPFCGATGPGGNVTSLQIVGETLYVGGEFQNATANYLLACPLDGGAPTSTVSALDDFPGPVYALAADSNGTLYAGGEFINVENIDAADNVAYLSGGAWHAMGAGAGACECAVDGSVRGLTTVGTDAYIGTDAENVDSSPEADHVARWDGAQWHAVGAGANGWFPTGTSVKDLTSTGSYLFVTGSFQNAGGDARADNVAFFDGTAWHPLGSNGAGDGPWVSETGHALAIIDRQLYAAGSFTSAGGDTKARAVASFALTQVIAYPTPTVTAGPSAAPTPTVTAGPSAVATPTVTPSPAPDAAAPRTSLRKASINQALQKATFRFASSEPGSTFACKLDRKSYKRCSSPKTYKKLAPGKHVFRVRARDRAGNVDRTPTVKRFRIKKR